HIGEPASGFVAKAVRKSNQRADQTAMDIVDGEAFNTRAEIRGTSYHELDHRDAEARSSSDLLFNFNRRPTHHLGGRFEPHGFFDALSFAEKTGFTEELV